MENYRQIGILYKWIEYYNGIYNYEMNADNYLQQGH